MSTTDLGIVGMWGCITAGVALSAFLIGGISATYEARDKAVEAVVAEYRCDPTGDCEFRFITED